MFLFKFFKQKRNKNGGTESNSKERPDRIINEPLETAEEINIASQRAHQLWLDKKYKEALSLYDLLLASLAKKSQPLYKIRERRAMVLCKLDRHIEAESEFQDIISTVERYAGRMSRSGNIFYWRLVAKYRGDEKRAMEEHEMELREI